MIAEQALDVIIFLNKAFVEHIETTDRHMRDLTFSHDDIQTMEKRFRTRLVNSISGFKSANLIGTRDQRGQENLAIVSSVVHLGSHPPLLGFVVRPCKTPRHTLQNIIETKVFTVNSVNDKIFQQSHQTSARYPKETSEFSEVGLTPYYDGNCPAPFVLESRLKIALTLKERIDIKSNDTVMLVGEVNTIHVPKTALMHDGFLDLDALGSVTISGLDSYHRTQRINRLSYAKPNKTVFPLTTDGEPSSWAAVNPIPE